MYKLSFSNLATGMTFSLVFTLLILMEVRTEFVERFPEYEGRSGLSSENITLFRRDDVVDGHAKGNLYLTDHLAVHRYSLQPKAGEEMSLKKHTWRHTNHVQWEILPENTTKYTSNNAYTDPLHRHGHHRFHFAHNILQNNTMY